jgi:hypothetical protein
MQIPVRLLSALGLWASTDKDVQPHLNQVVVRDGELLATDGHRLVRFPYRPSIGLAFGIRLHDVEDVADIAKAIGVANVVVVVSSGGVTVGIGPRVTFTCIPGKSADFPPGANLDAATAPRKMSSVPPAIAVDPLFLAHIHAVVAARPERGPGVDGAELQPTGVELVSWGTALEALEFRGLPAIPAHGTGDSTVLRPRYILMPIRM